MSSRAWRGVLLTLVVTIGLIAVPSAGARSRTGWCVRNGHGFSHRYGYTYMDSLWRYKTTCGVAFYVLKKHGRLSDWHCSRKTLAKSSTQYVDRETCTSGRRQVQWTYTQNT